MANLDGVDTFIAAAAVADYRPMQASAQKIKKGEGPLQLALERTDDILAQVAAHPRRPARVIGFAAETERLDEYATRKLRDKNLDAVAANDVSAAGLGFESEDNALALFTRDGRSDIGPASKAEVARILLQRIHALGTTAA